MIFNKHKADKELAAIVHSYTNDLKELQAQRIDARHHSSEYEWYTNIIETALKTLDRLQKKGNK